MWYARSFNFSLLSKFIFRFIFHNLFIHSLPASHRSLMNFLEFIVSEITFIMPPTGPHPYPYCSFSHYYHLCESLDSSSPSCCPCNFHEFITFFFFFLILYMYVYQYFPSLQCICSFSPKYLSSVLRSSLKTRFMSLFLKEFHSCSTGTAAEYLLSDRF